MQWAVLWGWTEVEHGSHPFDLWFPDPEATAASRRMTADCDKHQIASRGERAYCWPENQGRLLRVGNIWTKPYILYDQDFDKWSKGGHFRWQMPHMQSNWDVDTDAHAEKMGKLLISTRVYSWVVLYRVQSLLFDQNPVFPDRGFSRLTSLGHITILPDKQGHNWP